MQKSVLLLEDIAFKLYIKVYTNLFHILAERKKNDQNGFNVNFLAQIQFFLYFCTGSQISRFLWGRMSYDVTEAKRWACWYLFWYQNVSKTLSMLILINKILFLY